MIFNYPNENCHHIKKLFQKIFILQQKLFIITFFFFLVSNGRRELFYSRCFSERKYNEGDPYCRMDKSGISPETQDRSQIRAIK